MNFRVEENEELIGEIVNGICVTECPYQSHIRIGSVGCEEACWFFIVDNGSSETVSKVLCNYKKRGNYGKNSLHRL